ncbi:MAG TPA: flavin reductase family protein [Acidimicrobiales bacterium]
MSIEAFDSVTSSTDPAMIVVTTAWGGEADGCLVGFHSQSSMEPRRYAVWLSKANRTYRIAYRASHLAVHALSEHDRDLAVLFGTQTGDDVDKLAHCAWRPGPAGVPLLSDCPAVMVLRRLTLLDEGGDHVCVVGEPGHARSAGRFRPLRLSAVTDLRAGHPVGEQHDPPVWRRG